MTDWGAGRYEIAAAELAPVSEAVVERAALAVGEDVVDLACGTGNAALLAADRGARVVGVDGAPRLLEVARARARERGLEVDFREGGLASLPVEDDAADVVLSVFGVIFADEPATAMAEVARILRPEGRALMTAWIPAGPIDAMLTAMRETLGGPPPKRFAWSDTEAVGTLAGGAGLRLRGSTRAELAIRADSVDAYLDGGEEHPMAIAMRPAVQRAGVAQKMRDAMAAVLRDANEDASAFLVHSPYLVHELGPA